MEDLDLRTDVEQGTEDEENAAFEAAFDGKEIEPGGDSPAEPEVEETDVPVAGQDVEPSADEPEADKIKDLITKVKEIDDIKSRLKTVDKFYGRLGNVENALKSIPKFKRDALKKEFPEFEQFLYDDDEPGDSAAPEKDESSSQKQGRYTVQQQVQLELLKKDHPDWVEKKDSSEFKDWLSSKSEAEQQEFYNSWDSTYVSGVLTAFDENQKVSELEQDQQDSVTAEQEAAQKKASEAKRKRLLAAITPTDGRSSPAAIDTNTNDEEAAMLEAFNS